jgi:hypothetical protein
MLLHTAGRQLSEFGSFAGCPAGQLHELGGGLALLPLKSRHAERCFGLLLYWQGQPLLGWSVRTYVCFGQEGFLLLGTCSVDSCLNRWLFQVFGDTRVAHCIHSLQCCNL